MATFVDTNILLDIVTADPQWADWSVQMLETAAERGPLVGNAVTYAELSLSFSDVAETDEATRRFGLEIEAIPPTALFNAGRAFLAYRRRGGVRTSALPDFFIGAHAESLGVPLLTRDARFRTYFPALTIIGPSA